MISIANHQLILMYLIFYSSVIVIINRSKTTYKLSVNNKRLLEPPGVGTCFYYCTRFPYGEIDEWLRDVTHKIAIWESEKRTSPTPRQRR